MAPSINADAARQIAADTGLPAAVDSTRTTDGRFAPYREAAGITPVVLPTGVVAYQVGLGGLIFADRDAAVRFARNRAAKIARRNAR